MRKSVFFISTILAVSALFASCAKDAMEPSIDNGAAPETRAFGDKTPKVTAYIEVNDTNPLNAGLYEMDGKAFIDVVKIFAANIHANGAEPSLYFNDNITPIMADVNQYIRPLQAKGIKVLMTILGDHQGVGVANLSEENQNKFAEILVWTVEHYGLDGIDFDDEWSKYGENVNFPASVNGSFAGLITKLRAKLDARFPNEHKLVTVFDYGDASSLSGVASMIDYGWESSISYTSYGTCSFGLPNSKWSAQAINLNYSYNAFTLPTIKSRSQSAKTDGMGAIMTYDLRIHTERDPLNALKKIAEGAFSGTVTRSSSTGYTKNWTKVPAGHTITYADVQ